MIQRNGRASEQRHTAIYERDDFAPRDWVTVLDAIETVVNEAPCDLLEIRR